VNVSAVKLSIGFPVRLEMRDPATAQGAGRRLVHKHPPMHWWIQMSLNGLVVTNFYQRMLASMGTDFSFVKSVVQPYVGFLTIRSMV
jgi:hypothetical protein